MNMNLETYRIIGETLTLIVALVGFFLAFRIEMKKHTENITGSKIDEEKRHAMHERRISIMEERIGYVESSISYRLDVSNIRLRELTEMVLNNLQRYNEE